MIRTQLVALIVSLNVLVMPLTAAAQGAGISEADRWRDMVVRLEPAALVSVRLKDGPRMKGTVVGVEDGAFGFLPKTRIPVPARDIRFEDVVSIERATEGLSPGTKVVIGAGAVVGGLLLIVVTALANWD